MTKGQLKILGWMEGLGFALIAVLAMAAAAGIVLLLPIAAVLGGGAMLRMGSLVWLWWTGRVFLWSVRGIVAWHATVRRREVINTTVVRIDLTRYDAIEQRLTPLDHSGRMDWANSYISFHSGVDIAKVAGGELAGPSLVVGLPVLALCTPAELEALATRAFALRIEPISPLHLWIARIHRGAGDRLAWLNRRQSQSAFNVALALLESVTRPGVLRLAQFADEYTRSRIGRLFDSTMAKMGVIQTNWGVFVRRQLEPVLALGGLPPISAGFEEFVRRTRPDAISMEEPCYRSVEGMWANERKLCAALLRPELTASLRLVAWEDAVDTLAPDFWWKQTQPAQAQLEGKNVSDLPGLMVDWNRMCIAFLGDDARNLMPDTRFDRVVWLLGAVLARALTAAGWRAGSADLQDTACRKDGRAVDPFALVRQLARRKVSEAQFAQLCSEAGIGDVALWPPPPGAAGA